MPANSSDGFRTMGDKDSPGGGYKRNFNVNPTGRLRLGHKKRAVPSRSKSARTR